jgi:D-serine deaminase-like pyridoxal phosphate-dependent protein
MIRGVKLGDAKTPAAVLDLERLRRNTQRMRIRAERGGVTLRPHMKTAKSARVAELATAGQPGGIAVSTLAEADYFLGHGYRDITYAVCLAPSKVAEVAALQARGARIGVLTDSAEATAALAKRAARLETELRVLIEIDCGAHRAGVAWDGNALMEIARQVASAERLELAGVLTHGGHSYDCRSIQETTRVAEQERIAAVRAAGRLRTAGFPCATVSAGSTPTAVHAHTYEGLTEIRPGVYVFYDLAQLGRKCCRLDDLAFSVLATVISQQPEHGRLLVDAGALALSQDTSANAFLPGVGYGWVCDAVTAEHLGDLRVARVDQEHGYVEGADISFRQFPIGSQVRILPNHACMTAAAYSSYLIVHGNDEVIDTWDRVTGW